MKPILVVCTECIQYGRQAQVVALNSDEVSKDKPLLMWCSIHHRTEALEIVPKV